MKTSSTNELITHSNILPIFPWFYNTILEDAPIEHLGIYEWDKDYESQLEAITSEQYKEAAQEVAEKFFDFFLKEKAEFLKEKNIIITFEKLSSPQYYNYRNDQIYVQVTSPYTEGEFDALFSNDAESQDFIESFYYSM